MITVRTRALLLEVSETSGVVERLGFPERPSLNAVLPAADLPYPEIHDGYALGNLRIGLRRDSKPISINTASRDHVEPVEGGLRMQWGAAGVLAESTFRADGNDILWELAVANAGAGDLAITRLALPLTFNNWYHGYGTEDADLERLYHNTFYVHRRMAGESSAIYVQRLVGVGPDLAVVPENGTSWKTTHMARWSLVRYSSLVQWEGVPLVYLVSAELEDAVTSPLAVVSTPRPRRACPAGPDDRGTGALELPVSQSSSPATQGRGGRGDSEAVTTLEPTVVPHGEIVRYSLRFFRVRDGNELDAELRRRGRIVPRIVPGPVVPSDLPLRLAAEADGAAIDAASAETVSDPLAGTGDERSVVSASRPGDLRIEVTAPDRRSVTIAARVVAPLEELIRRRAAFIVAHQVQPAEGTPWDHGIFIWNDATKSRHMAHADYWGPGCYEGGVCDALFLAEKNGYLPDREEIAVLERYAAHYLRGRLQNPANDDVAWYFATPEGGALKTGRCYNYSHVINFYHAMYRIGRRYGLTDQDPLLYLDLAYRTAMRMFEIGWRYHLWSSGMMGMSRIWEVRDDLRAERGDAAADALQGRLTERARTLLALRFPYASECEYDTTSYEDVYFTARAVNDVEQMRRVVRCILAARHLTPTWYWYASDKRWWDAVEARPFRWVGDRGENCLHYTTASNSLVLLADLEEEQFVHDPRLAPAGYGGLLGPWALVRDDGFAAMCFCPDPASDHYGFNAFTGDIGLNLYCTLRGLKSYVVHPREGPPEPYGCDLEMPDRWTYRVTPRDGVRREVVFTAPRMRVHSDALALDSVMADRRQTRFEIGATNPSEAAVTATITIEGVWGNGFAWTVDGEERAGVQEGDSLRLRVDVPGRATVRLAARR